MFWNSKGFWISRLVFCSLNLLFVIIYLLQLPDLTTGGWVALALNALALLIGIPSLLVTYGEWE